MAPQRQTPGPPGRSRAVCIFPGDCLSLPLAGCDNYIIEDATPVSPSSFVCRIRDNYVGQEIEERAISPAGQAAHILRDRLLHLGCERCRDLAEPVRVIEIQCTPHPKRMPTGRGGPEQSETLAIVTDLVDLDAEVIALIFEYRWTIEIFFRFYKHILGCRHLLSYHRNGIELQTYTAILACMLISLWTGRKPTLRTFEMLCWYFTGMASLDELLAHIKRLQKTS